MAVPIFASPRTENERDRANFLAQIQHTKLYDANECAGHILSFDGIIGVLKHVQWSHIT
jgi:hypothetical protein